MSAIYEIVPATWPIAKQLALVMREADVREVWAAVHLSPEEGLLASMETAPDPHAGLVDGRVVCVFGVSEWSVLGLLGVPWLLTAEEMPRHARWFLKGSMDHMAKAQQRYRVLANYVDARNTQAVRWLGWLGFEIDPPLPFGFDGLPFHRFHWEAA